MAALAPNESDKIFRLAVTGGPCGGKSTVMPSLKEAFRARGFDVYCIPEVPTIMILGGCQYPRADAGQPLVEFEAALIRLQIQFEDSYSQVARSTGRPSVMIMDRGLLDIPAYLPIEKWKAIIDEMELKEAELASRYDLVIHLVSAADGAEAHYSCASNDARTETALEARALDAAVRANWSRSHPRITVVDNSTDFAGKLSRSVDAALRALEDFT